MGKTWYFGCERASLNTSFPPCRVINAGKSQHNEDQACCEVVFVERRPSPRGRQPSGDGSGELDGVRAARGESHSSCCALLLDWGWLAPGGTGQRAPAGCPQGASCQRRCWVSVQGWDTRGRAPTPRSPLSASSQHSLNLPLSPHRAGRDFISTTGLCLMATRAAALPSWHPKGSTCTSASSSGTWWTSCRTPPRLPSASSTTPGLAQPS